LLAEWTAKRTFEPSPMLAWFERGPANGWKRRILLVATHFCEEPMSTREADFIGISPHSPDDTAILGSLPTVFD